MKLAYIVGIIAAVAVVSAVSAAIFLGFIPIQTAQINALNGVPDDIDAVGFVNCDKIINDADIQDIVEAILRKEGSEHTSFDDAYAEFKELVKNTSGIDPDDVTYIVFFGKLPESYASQQYFALIIEGDINIEDVLEKMRKSSGEMTEETYKDVKVYVSERGYPTKSACCVIDNLFIMGTKDAVYDSIDAYKSEERFSGDLRNVFDDVSGDLVKYAVRIPEKIREQIEKEQLPPNMPLMIDLSSLSKMDIIAFGLSKRGSTFSECIKIHTTDESAAKDVKDMIEGMLQMYRGMAPEDVKAVIERIKISQAGKTISISQDVSAEELKKAIEEMELPSFTHPVTEPVPVPMPSAQIPTMPPKPPMPIRE